MTITAKFGFHQNFFFLRRRQIDFLDGHRTRFSDNSGFASDDDEGSCGGGGLDVVYEFTIAGEYDVFIEASGFDTVLYVRTDCTDSSSEIACNDDHSSVDASSGSDGSSVVSPD